MRNYEFYYLICDAPDKNLFTRQCNALEQHIPDLEKDPILEDVDGSLLQIYHHEFGQIRVSNSHFYGELSVESDFDLLQYFKK